MLRAVHKAYEEKIENVSDLSLRICEEIEQSGEGRVSKETFIGYFAGPPLADDSGRSDHKLDAATNGTS